MLTAVRLGAVEAQDVVDLLPALINASTAVSTAVGTMSTTVTGAMDHVTTAVDRLAALPAQFVREARTGVQDVGYVAGKSFGRGVGWGLLPSVLIGTGIILTGLLAYRYAAVHVEKRAELVPA